MYFFQVPQKIDEKFVLHQLRCSGTLQTIKLEQSRYPERLTTDQFLEQYKVLVKHVIVRKTKFVKSL